MSNQATFFTPTTIVFTRESIIQEVNEGIIDDGGQPLSPELFTDEVCQKYADLMGEGLAATSSSDTARVHFLALIAVRDAILADLRILTK